MVELNSLIKCMIIDHDKVNGRIALSTKVDDGLYHLHRPHRPRRPHHSLSSR